MSSLEPRSGRHLTRKQKEARAYRLVMAGGTAGAVAVLGLVLAAVGAISFGIPVLAAIVAVVCLVLFRRSVGLR